MNATALIAIGGNALIHRQHGAVELPPSTEGVVDSADLGGLDEERLSANRVSREIAGLVRLGWRVLITHGNGPQVGAALLRSEHAREVAYPQSLNLCVAATQAEIGYLLQQSMRRALDRLGLPHLVATIVTQAVVDPGDPAFAAPSKPIGPSYASKRARVLQRLGWSMTREADGQYRRSVASPEPRAIVEADVIRRLLGAGVVVIAAGGGGIPVVRRDGQLVGIDCVIDKDRTSALLATELDVDLLLLATDVEHIYLNYERDDRCALGHIQPAELERHLAAGQFPAGTMGPKVEAALRFLHAGGREVIVTTSDRLVAAVRERAGTHVAPAPETQRAPGHTEVAASSAG